MMTPDAFRRWLASMQEAGLARSDAECSRLLGITTETTRVYKIKGADQRTALACAALLRQVEPYV